jgi:dihydroxyacetone kinase DhaKLM complex PTS-EIIA-like component DhaM
MIDDEFEVFNVELMFSFNACNAPLVEGAGAGFASAYVQGSYLSS